MHFYWIKKSLFICQTFCKVLRKILQGGYSLSKGTSYWRHCPSPDRSFNVYLTEITWTEYRTGMGILTLITANTFWNVMLDIHMNSAPLMFITPSWSRCWLKNMKLIRAATNWNNKNVSGLDRVGHRRGFTGLPWFGWA